MNVPGVKTFMVMNEPPATRATTANNDFILRVIAAAHALTDKPISVRFMAGSSPSTGHYSPEIDAACDFLARNTYWDPRNPTVSVYGTTEAKLLNAVNAAHSQGKRSGSQSSARKILIPKIRQTTLQRSCSTLRITKWIGFSVGLPSQRVLERPIIFGMGSLLIPAFISWLTISAGICLISGMPGFLGEINECLLLVCFCWFFIRFRNKE